MTRPILALAALIAAPALARADVTVVYAPAAPAAPLVARPVCAPPPAEVPAASPRPTQPEPTASALPSPSASASPPRAEPELDPAALAPECTSPTTITVVRAGSTERASLALTDCSGRADPASVGELSLLARPAALETRPSARELADHADDPEWVAAGVRRLHPGVAERLRALADRFPGHAIELVAGFQPDAREGSRHLHGLAIDVRVIGASLDAVHAHALRFDRTGVGLHAREGFIHIDVRERTMHWIDDGEGPPELDDTPRRGSPIRDAEPIPEGTLDETALDPDAVADEVLRGLGDIRLPSR